MAKLSMVLATDSEATIRPVVEHLRGQTWKHEIELVLVCPEALPFATECGTEFAAIRTVPHPVDSLARARAAGVRAAGAHLVFIGETHSFADARFAERTIPAFDDPQWSVVVPALRNGNPHGVLSWSGFLCDYGAWAEELPEGEIDAVPVYNATFRRDLLLSLGESLPLAFDQSDDLDRALRSSGRRALFLPSTHVSHVNATQAWPWVRNRFLGGTLIASNRSGHWPRWRRLIYAAGAFLVPIVLLPRMMSGVNARVLRGPIGTMPFVLLSLALRAAGETLGYAGLFRRTAQSGMLHLELHKLRYAGRR